jgi:hypothetical protein
MDSSGRGAAWLARLLGVQEVPSSNLGGPTKFLKDLQTADLPQLRLWSPTESKMDAGRGLRKNSCVSSGALSSLKKPDKPDIS